MVIQLFLRVKSESPILLVTVPNYLFKIIVIVCMIVFISFLQKPTNKQNLIHLDIPTLEIGHLVWLARLSGDWTSELGIWLKPLGMILWSSSWKVTSGAGFFLFEIQSRPSQHQTLKLYPNPLLGSAVAAGCTGCNDFGRILTLLCDSSCWTAISLTLSLG